jgi:hypothetical protein
LFENRESAEFLRQNGVVSRRKPQDRLSPVEDFQHRKRTFWTKKRCLRFFKQALF